MLFLVPIFLVVMGSVAKDCQSGFISVNPNVGFVQLG